MENHEGDRANDELIKSLGGATIIDELREGNSELTSLGEISGDEPTQIETQERKDDSKVSEKGEENKGNNSDQSRTTSDDIAFGEIKRTPIKIEDEEKLNDFKTDNVSKIKNLLSVNSIDHEDKEILLKDKHLNESCMHNKYGKTASKKYENPASDILEKNVCGDKSDDTILKFEGSSEVSQTESGSLSNIFDEYKRFNGHKFDKDDVLRDKNGKRFNFNFYENHYQNQKRYEEIGKDVDDYIYELLQTRCKMVRHITPFDATPDEPQGFFFASENAEKTEDKLLVLIHGSGVVRAGQWARRIIINDNLMDGSQIPYIEQAYKDGYEVVVLNTNQNEINHHPIRGNECAEQHALYVWDNFIMERVKAKHIAIMAHSYGGVVTVSLAKQESFRKRVFAIGFSDSVHTFGMNIKTEVKDFFKKYARNWVASEEDLGTPIQKSYFSTDCIERHSAGHEQHEWTSTTCMKSVFQFFEEKFKEAKQAESSEVDETYKHSSYKIKTAATSDMDLGQSEIHDCQSGTSFNPSEIAGQIERSEAEFSETLVDSTCKYQHADFVFAQKKEEKNAEDVAVMDITKTNNKLISLKDGQVSNPECKED